MTWLRRLVLSVAVLLISAAAAEAQTPPVRDSKLILTVTEIGRAHV